MLVAAQPVQLLHRPQAQQRSASVLQECSIPGKAAYVIWRTNFEIDDKYVPIKAIGKGAYGVVCSADNRATGEKVSSPQTPALCSKSHKACARRWLSRR